jgi:autotransporter-associated beta strand protein
VRRAGALGAERLHAAGIAGRMLFRAGWAALLASAAPIAAALPAAAQDATWLANPGSGDFNTAANWNPAAVPTGTASFGASNTTALTFSVDTPLDGLTFLPGAPAYTFTVNNTVNIDFNGAGIVNGGSVTIINNGGINFSNPFPGAPTAGSATIINNGSLGFAENSTPGNAALVNNGTINFLSSGPNGDSKISAGSIAGGGTFHFFSPDELTVGSNNLSTTVSGEILGVGGSLVKIGSGTLTFSNTSLLFYRGPTTVNGGTLEVDSTLRSVSTTVNAGGTLSGTGAAQDTQINFGGTLAPGNAANPTGTFTMGTNLAFQSGAIYLVTLSGANAANTNVAGAAASLAGTVQGALGAGGAVLTSYDILHADGGLGGTTFSGVSVPNYVATLTYSPTDVFLDVTAAALGTGTTLNGNQQAVAGAINSFVNNGGALLPQFANIFNLTGSNLANTLTQLDGEVGTDAQKGASQLMNQFLNLMFDPSSGGGGGGGGNASGFAPEQAGLPPDIALAYAAVLKAPPQATFDRRWTTWGSAFGGSSTTDGNATIGSNNVSAHDYGFAGGMDYHLDPATVLGFALAGGGTNWNLAQGLGNGRSDAFQAGIYGKRYFGPAYLSGALAFTNNWFTTSRTALGDQLTASFSGQSYAARLEAGYRYGLPAPAASVTAGITPYAALQTQLFHTPTYTETDLTGGGFGLAYNATTATDTRSELGARFDDLVIVDHMPLVLRARAAWAHDWLSNSSLTAVFQALPGAGFIVNGATPPKDSALTTAEAELRLTANWSLLAKFDGEFADGSQTYAGTGTVRYTW